MVQRCTPSGRLSSVNGAQQASCGQCGTVGEYLILAVTAFDSHHACGLTDALKMFPKLGRLASAQPGVLEAIREENIMCPIGLGGNASDRACHD